MQWKNRNVLVTGGCGMIGSALTRKLVNLGANVRVVDDLSRGKLYNVEDIKDKIEFMKLDLTNFENAKSAVKGQEKVFMFAAVLGSINELINKPAEIGYRNLLIDMNTFEAARREGIRHIMFASSAAVYGKDCKVPLGEDDLEIGKSFFSIYGRCKYLSEHMLKAYGKQYHIKSAILRFFNVYSSVEPFSLESHVIPALCYKAMVLKQDPFVIWGSGEQTRSFVHTYDVIDGILMAMEKAPNGMPINLGTPDAIKIKDLANKILELTGHNPSKIIFDTNKPEGAHDRTANDDRAKEILGWVPKLTLEDGLKETIEGFKKRMCGNIHRPQNP